jgi:multimeric flavodoxin WrbA
VGAARDAGGDVPSILIVYHSATGGTRQMVEAAGAGAHAAEPAVEVRLLHADAAGSADLLAADGYLFATPENLAAICGVVKHFFDRTYYAALDRIVGRPYAAMVCAGTDGSNAVRQLERIATGWRLEPIAPALIVLTGAQTADEIGRTKHLTSADLRRCHELGATLAGGLALGIF